MKLTIIETGLVPEPIRDQFPDYPAMFRDLFAEAGADFRFETVSVVRGAPLPDPAGLGGILITGSPAGVYDPEPWIAPLKDFIRRAAAARVPQAGICFGHQIMAEAFGGRVEKSEKGWGTGRHAYQTLSPPTFEKVALPETIRIAVSHQDQVVDIPPGARVMAASGFTPAAGLSFDFAPAISLQCHPEFTADYAAALYMARRGAPLAPENVEEAVASLNGACDRLLLGRWMAAFFRSSAL